LRQAEEALARRLFFLPFLCDMDKEMGMEKYQWRD
jgi:hypothetical protein